MDHRKPYRGTRRFDIKLGFDTSNLAWVLFLGSMGVEWGWSKLAEMVDRRHEAPGRRQLRSLQNGDQIHSGLGGIVRESGAVMIGDGGWSWFIEKMTGIKMEIVQEIGSMTRSRDGKRVTGSAVISLHRLVSFLTKWDLLFIVSPKLLFSFDLRCS